MPYEPLINKVFISLKIDFVDVLPSDFIEKRLKSPYLFHSICKHMHMIGFDFSFSFFFVLFFFDAI